MNFIFISNVGNIHVLETTLAVLVMMGAVGWVAHFQLPPAGDERAAADLQRAADDFLATAMDATQLPSKCDGETELERLVLEGLRGGHDAWKKRTESFFPAGIEAELFLDNSRQLYSLQSKSGFMGITSEADFGPDFTYLFPMLGLETVDGQSHFVAETIGVHDAEIMRLKGDAIRARVFVAGERQMHYDGWGITALLEDDAEAQGRGFGQNLTWALEDGVPSQVLQMTPMDSFPDAYPRKARITVQPPPRRAGAVSELPIGTSLVLDIPEGITVAASIHPDWEQTEDGRGGIRFLLARQMEGDSTLELHLKPPSNPVRPYDVLHARLGNGSLGESSLVVTYPSSVERSLPRAVHPTVPYPLRPGTRALFGVAFANGGERTVVTQVDVEVPGGYDVWRNDGEGAELFAEAELLRPSDEDGTWARLDARHLRWTGSRVVEALGASSWTVGALVTDDAGEATSVEPASRDGPVGTLRFSNGFQHASTRWGAVPGVVRHDVPPASGPDADDGYPWLAAGGADGGHEVALSAPGATLRGRSGYEVSAASGDLLRLQSSLANSTFAVRERKVPVGGLLRADADFESVVNGLGKAGVADTTLRVDLYAPPSRGCAPTATWTRDSRSLPLARVRGLAVWDAEGLGVADLFLAAEDGQAYRVDRVGAPLWSADLGGAPRLLLASGPCLVVALQGGDVLRLDPRTGARLWSARGTGDVDALEAVIALAAQPAQGRLLVGTSAGALRVLDLATGDALASPELPLDGGILQVEAGAEGRVVVAREGGVVLLGPDLSLVAARPLSGTVGVAVAPARVLAATGGAVLDLGPDDLSVAREEAAPQEVALAAAGDATGDGVPDLVVAMRDLGVRAVDGATGRLAWERRDAAWLEPTAATDPFRPEDALRRADPVGLCAVAATYQDAREACPRDAGSEQSAPLLLRVGRERVYVAHVHRGNPYLDGLDHAGRLVAQAFLPQVPDALAPGAWTVGEGVAVALADGTVHVYEGADWRSPALEARPSSFVGRFTFSTPVPAGGFFGSHLLVATLGWTEQGTTREARLFDWFEVVGPDGKPVLHPSYRVVLVAQDRGDPVDRPSRLSPAR